MIVEHSELFISPVKRFTDLKPYIRHMVSALRANNGTVTVFSEHTTACIKILEDEVLSLKDITNHLDALAPKDARYLHDDLLLREVPLNERINGYAHIQSLYFNHSETIPIVNGALELGVWQTPFLIELDPYRERKVKLTYIGTTMDNA